MATIRERRPGVFEVRGYVGRDERGRPRQVSKTVRGTLRDAKRAAAELDALPASPDGADTTLGTLLELWVEASEPGWAPSTAANQKSRVRLVARDAVA